MAEHEAPQQRRDLTDGDLERVDRIVRSAWQSLPDSHRSLLEAIGASQWQVVQLPLGVVADDLLRSAGQPLLDASVRKGLGGAVGAWVPLLRVVLINAGHPALAGLGDGAHERFVARVAWHEWGHALAVDRCSAEDVDAGQRLLRQAPPGVAESVRQGGYRRRGYTHQLVAEVYALLISRRRRGQTERPEWLNEEIYNLTERVTGSSL